MDFGNGWTLEWFMTHILSLLHPVVQQDGLWRRSGSVAPSLCVYQPRLGKQKAAGQGWRLSGSQPSEVGAQTEKPSAAYPSL